MVVGRDISMTNSVSLLSIIDVTQRHLLVGWGGGSLLPGTDVYTCHGYACKFPQDQL